MNEPGESKQSMEEAIVEATELLALGVAPAVPSSIKVRGHDRVTLDHDVGAERNGPRGGTGRVWCLESVYGWGRTGRGVKRSRVNDWRGF